MADSDNFVEYRMYYSKELTRINNVLEELNTGQGDIKVEIAKLQMKAGVWGAIAGFIPVAFAMLIWFFEHKG